MGLALHGYFPAPSVSAPPALDHQGYLCRVPQEALYVGYFCDVDTNMISENERSGV